MKHSLCTVQALVAALLATLPDIGMTEPATAAASQPTASATRSVSWYANNPQARAITELDCIDDPKRFARTSDCKNARQASDEVTAPLRRRKPTLDPRKLEFWSEDPLNRHNKLLMCRRSPNLNYCDVARRSLMVEAGQPLR